MQTDYTERLIDDFSNLKNKNNNVSIQIKEVSNKTTKENSNFMSKYKELIKKREEKVKYYKNKDSAIQDSENKQQKSISNSSNDSIVPEYNDIQKDIKIPNTNTSPSNDNISIDFNKLKCVPIKPKIVVSLEYVTDIKSNNYDDFNIEDTLITEDTLQPVDTLLSEDTLLPEDTLLLEDTLLPEDTFLSEDNETRIDINDKIKQNDITKFNNIDNIENYNINNSDISKSYIDYYSEKSMNTHLIKENVQFKIKTNSNVNSDYSDGYHSEIANTSSFTRSLKNNTDVSKFEDFNKNENLNTLRCTSSREICNGNLVPSLSKVFPNLMGKIINIIKSNEVSIIDKLLTNQEFMNILPEVSTSNLHKFEKKIILVENSQENIDENKFDIINDDMYQTIDEDIILIPELTDKIPIISKGDRDNNETLNDHILSVSLKNKNDEDIENNSKNGVISLSNNDILKNSHLNNLNIIEKSVKCAKCSFNSDEHKILLLHEKRHHEEIDDIDYLFKCDRGCNFTTDRFDKYIKHLSYHIYNNCNSDFLECVYAQCSICPFASSIFNLVKTHVKEMHPNIECMYNIKHDNLINIYKDKKSENKLVNSNKEIYIDKDEGFITDNIEYLSETNDIEMKTNQGEKKTSSLECLNNVKIERNSDKIIHSLEEKEDLSLILNDEDTNEIGYVQNINDDSVNDTSYSDLDKSDEHVSRKKFKYESSDTDNENIKRKRARKEITSNYKDDLTFCMCSYCDVVKSNLKEMKQHIYIVHCRPSTHSFNCWICEFTSDNVDILVSHLDGHINVYENIFAYNNIKIKSKGDVYIALFNDDGAAINSIRNLSKYFNFPHIINPSSKMLNGGDLFACNYCKYTCSTLSMIKIHIEKNHLQCEISSRYMDEPRKFCLNKFKTYLNVENYCEFCNEIISINEMYLHVNKVHHFDSCETCTFCIELHKNAEIICDICKEIYYSISYFKTHRRNHFIRKRKIIMHDFNGYKCINSVSEHFLQVGKTIYVCKLCQYCTNNENENIFETHLKHFHKIRNNCQECEKCRANNTSHSPIKIPKSDDNNKIHEFSPKIKNKSPDMNSNPSKVSDNIMEYNKKTSDSTPKIEYRVSESPSKTTDIISDFQVNTSADYSLKLKQKISDIILSDSSKFNNKSQNKLLISSPKNKLNPNKIRKKKTNYINNIQSPINIINKIPFKKPKTNSSPLKNITLNDNISHNNVIDLKIEFISKENEKLSINHNTENLVPNTNISDTNVVGHLISPLDIKKEINDNCEEDTNDNIKQLNQSNGNKSITNNSSENLSITNNDDKDTSNQPYFSCGLCEISENIYDKIQPHVLTHFINSPEYKESIFYYKPYSCETCKFKSLYKDQVNDHIKKEHINIRNVRTKYTPVAKLELLISNHVSVEIGKRPNNSDQPTSRSIKKIYVCIFEISCSYSATGRNNIINHVKKHLHYNPYVCPICFTSFRTISSCNNHIKNHKDNDKKYVSEIDEKMEKLICDYYRIDLIETYDTEELVHNDDSVDSADNSKSDFDMFGKEINFKSTTIIKKEPQIVEPLECGGTSFKMAEIDSSVRVKMEKSESTPNKLFEISPGFKSSTCTTIPMVNTSIVDISHEVEPSISLTLHIVNKSIVEISPKVEPSYLTLPIVNTSIVDISPEVEPAACLTLPIVNTSIFEISPEFKSSTCSTVPMVNTTTYSEQNPEENDLITEQIPNSSHTNISKHNTSSFLMNNLSNNLFMQDHLYSHLTQIKSINPGICNNKATLNNSIKGKINKLSNLNKDLNLKSKNKNVSTSSSISSTLICKKNKPSLNNNDISLKIIKQYKIPMNNKSANIKSNLDNKLNSNINFNISNKTSKDKLISRNISEDSTTYIDNHFKNIESKLANNEKKNIQPHTKNNNFSIIKKDNKIITKKVPRKIGKNDEKKIKSLKKNNEIDDCEDSLKNYRPYSCDCCQFNSLYKDEVLNHILRDHHKSRNAFTRYRPIPKFEEVISVLEDAEKKIYVKSNQLKASSNKTINGSPQSIENEIKVNLDLNSNDNYTEVAQNIENEIKVNDLNTNQKATKDPQNIENEIKVVHDLNSNEKSIEVVQNIENEVKVNDLNTIEKYTEVSQNKENEIKVNDLTTNKKSTEDPQNIENEIKVDYVHDLNSNEKSREVPQNKDNEIKVNHVNDLNSNVKSIKAPLNSENEIKVNRDLNAKENSTDVLQNIENEMKVNHVKDLNPIYEQSNELPKNIKNEIESNRVDNLIPDESSDYSEKKEDEICFNNFIKLNCKKSKDGIKQLRMKAEVCLHNIFTNTTDYNLYCKDQNPDHFTL